MQKEEQDKILLDSSSFKALASETRVLILKELDKKRCTASEMGKILGISVQAASEHLENLRVAGLVERVDEGRKWIYFDLTEKGKAVLHPDKSKRLWVLLSIFALILAGAGFMLFSQGAQQSSGVFNPSSQLPSFESSGEQLTAQVSTEQSNAGTLDSKAALPTNSTASNGTR